MHVISLVGHVVEKTGLIVSLLPAKAGPAAPARAPPAPTAPAATRSVAAPPFHRPFTAFHRLSTNFSPPFTALSPPFTAVPLQGSGRSNVCGRWAGSGSQVCPEHPKGQTPGNILHRLMPPPANRPCVLCVCVASLGASRSQRCCSQPRPAGWSTPWWAGESLMRCPRPGWSNPFQ